MIDLRTLKPLDLDAIVASLEKTRPARRRQRGRPRRRLRQRGRRARHRRCLGSARVAPERVTAKDTPIPYAAVARARDAAAVADVVAGVRPHSSDDKDSIDNGGSNMSVRISRPRRRLRGPGRLRRAASSASAAASPCVTGGGSGLGAAMAVGLAQAGARDRRGRHQRRGRGARPCATIAGAAAARPSARRCDVTDARRVEAPSTRSSATHGRVDVLVNSAGTAFRCPAEDFPEERLDAVLDAQPQGHVPAAPGVRARRCSRGARGSIINIASIGGFDRLPARDAPTMTSKGGVVQLTRALALEWIDRGVRVTRSRRRCSTRRCPPAAHAGVGHERLHRRPHAARRDRSPPHELVGAALFLASDASRAGHRATRCAVDDGYLAA